MILLMTMAYAGLLLVLIKIGVFKEWAKWMTGSVVAVFLGFAMVFFVPMDFGAPSGPVVVLKNSVQISPNVAGPVVEVPVQSGRLIEKNETLFKIDPVPYQAGVDALEAQLSLARLRLEQTTYLAEKEAGRESDVQQFDAEVRKLEADLNAARWNLEQTIVRAPSDGQVPNVVLRPGVRVAPGQAVMPFIDESAAAVTVQIRQIHARHVKPGDTAEVIFKLYPGETFPAKVIRLVKANPSGQATPGGLTLSLDSIRAEPFLVQLELEDTNVELPAGAVGTAAIYTDQFTGLTHLFRRLMLQQQNWMNYVQI
jgi:RND family efflux transporter MFP subunit